MIELETELILGVFAYSAFIFASIGTLAFVMGYRLGHDYGRDEGSNGTAFLLTHLLTEVVDRKEASTESTKPKTKKGN